MATALVQIRVLVKADLKVLAAHKVNHSSTVVKLRGLSPLERFICFMLEKYRRVGVSQVKV